MFKIKFWNFHKDMKKFQLSEKTIDINMLAIGRLIAMVEAEDGNEVEPETFLLSAYAAPEPVLEQLLALPILSPVYGWTKHCKDLRAVMCGECQIALSNLVRCALLEFFLRALRNQ